MEFFDRLSALCLSYPGVFLDHPWGPEAPVFKTPKNKLIAMAGVEDGELRVTVKLTPDEGAEALLLPFVSKAAYVGKYGWVTARISGETEWEIVEPWVRRSYELVSAGAAKRKRGA